MIWFIWEVLVPKTVPSTLCHFCVMPSYEISIPCVLTASSAKTAIPTRLLMAHCATPLQPQVLTPVTSAEVRGSPIRSDVFTVLASASDAWRCRLNTWEKSSATFRTSILQSSTSEVLKPVIQTLPNPVASAQSCLWAQQGWLWRCTCSDLGPHQSQSTQYPQHITGASSDMECFQKCISSCISSVSFHGSPPFLRFHLPCLIMSVHLFPFLPWVSSHVSPPRHPPVSPFFLSPPGGCHFFPKYFCSGATCCCAWLELWQAVGCSHLLLS